MYEIIDLSVFLCVQGVTQIAMALSEENEDHILVGGAGRCGLIDKKKISYSTSVQDDK